MRVTRPPNLGLLGAETPEAGWYHAVQGERIECDVCPRSCQLKPGDRGFCFVRSNQNGHMRLETYGRSTGFCIDPIEKKPLYHFYPGTPVLSFGTAGCNLGCKFCQNWEISKSKTVAQLSQSASPEQIAQAAVNHRCRSVAMTYNDPVIWLEYAIDTALACRAKNVAAVAVTAGYVQPEARQDFFEVMDATNIDLKAFTESFYWKVTGSHLRPVLDTLVWVRHESTAWLEITNLVIPDLNDRADEFRAMCLWIYRELGSDVPLHFSAFHPDFRMQDRGRTSLESLKTASKIAADCGLEYVYLGNVDSPSDQSTDCPKCHRRLIGRDRYKLDTFHVVDSACDRCGHEIPGRFAQEPGNWGRRRQPIELGSES